MADWKRSAAGAPPPLLKETRELWAFPEVTRMLSKVADGTPKVETYEVANSTFHKVHA